MTSRLHCVLCPAPAITTAAHVPVCEIHWQQYKAEAAQYLPHEQRTVHRRIMAAHSRLEAFTVVCGGGENS